MSHTNINIHEIVSISISGPKKYYDPELEVVHYKFVFKDINNQKLCVSVHSHFSDLLNDFRKIIED